MDRSQIIVLGFSGFQDVSLAAAACRAGGQGVLDLEYVSTVQSAFRLIDRLARHTDSPFGMRVPVARAEFIGEILSAAPAQLAFVILAVPGDQDIRSVVDSCKRAGKKIFLECTCIAEAETARVSGADAVIAKGNEAGGLIGRESTFVLLQRFLNNGGLPVWAQGGIGLHTAAACMAAGAAGIVLDCQLAFTRESPLSGNEKKKLAPFDGTETLCLGEEEDTVCFRLLSRMNPQLVKSLQENFRKIVREESRPDNIRSALQAVFSKYVAEVDEAGRLYPFGQDIALAGELGRKFVTVGGVMGALCLNVEQSLGLAADQLLASSANGIADFHGTVYPFVQGPMARVSDRPAFAEAVAAQGALPFMAAAMMTGERLDALLRETAALLREKPWGVGLLGFLPADHYQDQVRVVLANKPRFALIAGGRPAQVRELEANGIITYVHVPSPALLRMFLEAGLKRFVFEGREAGGHIAPLGGFVLWEMMTDILLQHVSAGGKAEGLSVLYAGGIHDARSAAMISCLAAPLAATGVRIGFQLGSAYLFTDEAVSSGAIVERYRREVIHCDHTVILETGLGHASRCTVSPFVKTFFAEKQKMLREGISPAEIRDRLEKLNIGRLQVASRGIMKDPDRPGGVRSLDDAEQYAAGLYMVGQLAALRNEATSIAALHENMAAGAAAILERLGMAAGPVGPAKQSPSDIAVIGMSCILPGAQDTGTYWENILNKVDAIREVPPERWDWHHYFQEDRAAKDKSYSKWGGFLGDYPFNPIKYGIPPNSLSSIEPLQLLSLEVASQAIEDAGYANRPFCREKTSVIFGISGAGELGQLYSFRSTLPMLFGAGTEKIIAAGGSFLPEWTEDSFPGILMNVAAGRIANRFNLGGTNFTVDAACASSLAAVYLGVKELENGTSDMVVVGAADSMQNPFTFLCFAKTNALSPRGRCRTFDDEADGIAIGEGVAALVLKRLADAERDGDRIFCVIKAVGAASDGRGKSLTAPRVEGQVRAFRRAYEKADVGPDSVGLVEAHGTGTVVGDQVEVEALNTFFAESGAGSRQCALGSVKSLIGHTKACAGIAGLVKAGLALYHKTLPPTAGITRPNAALRAPASPFYANIDVRPWVQDMTKHPRRAGVSALGFGGTNFHVVLEEYTRSLSPLPLHAGFQQWPAELFLFRGETRQEIAGQLQDLQKILQTAGDVSLADLSYTILFGKSEQRGKASDTELTLAVIASTVADLRARLDSSLLLLGRDEEDIHDQRGVYFAGQPLARSGKVVFLFPGQGSQYENMCADLAVQFPDMMRLLERADQLLAGKFAKPLSAFVYPPPAFTEEEKKKNTANLAQTWVAQPAMGALSLAIYHLLQEFGIKPDMAAGHSYGEYVALAAAGVIGEDDLLHLSEARGRYMVKAAGAEPGVMAAVKADAATVNRFLSGMADIWIANLNSPEQTIISGTRQSVMAAVEKFTAADVRARQIPVACAFHSPIVAGAGAMLKEHLNGLDLKPPAFPVYSNTTATVHSAHPAELAEQLAAHLAQGVQFVREIENIHADGGRIFVECGPGRVLTGLVQTILAGRACAAVTANQSGRSGFIELVHLLGQLAAQGVPVKPQQLFARRKGELLDFAALAKTGGKNQYPPGTWLLNGAWVRPAAMPAQAALAGQLAAMVTSGLPRGKEQAFFPETPSAAGGVEDAGLALNFPGEQLAAAAHISPGPAAALGEYDQVMLQHQQLMQRFLEIQHQVMASYLHEQSVAPGHILAADARGAGPAAVSREPEPIARREEEETLPGKDAPAISPAGIDIRAILKTIVSERTGYPLEMLVEEQDLEADLGIDSIKRVEILAGFLRSVFPGGPDKAPVSADSLGKLRTLGKIIEHVENAGPAGGNAPGITPSSAGKQPAAGQEAGPVPSRPDLFGQLQAIVSERTGYPLEMLVEEQDLEADLGIDSIKRVEILAGFLRSVFPGGPDKAPVSADSLGKLRTLGQIIDQVRQQTTAPRQEESQGATVSAGKTAGGPVAHFAENGILLPRFTLRTVAVDGRHGAASAPLPRGVLLITADEYGIAASLADTLAKAGCQVALLYRQGQEIDSAGENVHRVAVCTLEGVAEVLTILRRRYGPVGGLIHLSPLRKGASFPELGFAEWLERLESDVAYLFYLVKNLEKDVRRPEAQGSAAIIAATAMGGTFGVSGAASAGGIGTNYQPSQGGVVGLLKTVREEWPEVRVKAVDMHLDEPVPRLADQLLAELRSADGSAEIGYRHGRRLQLELVPAPPAGRDEIQAGLGPDSVILITGGARGITADAALELAGKYQAQLILVGRTPKPADREDEATKDLLAMPELKAAFIAEARQAGVTVTLPEVEARYQQLVREREMRRNMAAIAEAGARVEYIQADVRDPEIFGGVIDDIYRRYGSIDGVIHGAGIIRDKLIADLTPESFQQVLGTKAESVFILSRKIRPAGLKFFVLFSSVAGRFGNPGQSAYTAANEVMNKVAVYLNEQWPGRVVAINWGPWKSGMVSLELERQFGTRGVRLIAQREGAAMLGMEITHGRKEEVEVVIGDGPWGQIDRDTSFTQEQRIL